MAPILPQSKNDLCKQAVWQTLAICFAANFGKIKLDE
jgi:hypothetical protein